MDTNNIPGIRFVRCPKCKKVLTENAEIPVYKCGGCGTVLRAKHHIATLEAGMSSSSLGNSSKNMSVSSSLNREFMSAAKQQVPDSFKADAAVERVATSELAFSNSITANVPDQREESSDHPERGSEGEDETNPEAELKLESRVKVEREQFTEEQSEKPVPQGLQGRNCLKLSDREEESSEFKRGQALDEQDDDNFKKQSPQHCDSLKLSDQIEQSPESSGTNAESSEPEEMKLAEQEGTYSYDGSASSPGRSPSNRLPQKYRLLSRRTFRHKKVACLVDTIEKQEEVEGQKLPKESSVSPIRKSSNVQELFSRPCDPAMRRDMTFGSEDFHSVQNWIGSETDAGASKSLSEDILLHATKLDKKPTKLDLVEPQPMKILRKVDELRDELSEFLTKTVERRSLSSRFQYQIPGTNSPSAQPHCKEKKLQGIYPPSAQPPCKEKKLQVIKSYCRPVSGGAPFVICYKCRRLLQLPADFLVTQKRLHKLKCGACSELLVFSFRARDRAVPMTPVEARHPPSEVDNNSNNYRNGWGSASYSADDYDQKVLHVSRNSSYSIEERDQLHRLMGYNSASELLFRPRGGGEGESGYQSTEPSTPHFYRPSEEDMRYGPNANSMFAPYSVEIQEEEDEFQERLRNRRKGSGLQELLKKGVKELSHGLENVKLKING